ncbi:hypothetical protein D9758_016612 [Tetrapyrgos nigripes]|uniref:Protein kinase domain-containing protein n=1 Tax=Tetrapyrgos nigripes TaxID=182062 RepID=A0A8H5FIG0_9AGAR|nr:hypothetical protein D9758_016612 [Tetrapyrgos nigripes]
MILIEEVIQLQPQFSFPGDQTASESFSGLGSVPNLIPGIPEPKMYSQTGNLAKEVTHVDIILTSTSFSESAHRFHEMDNSWIITARELGLHDARTRASLLGGSRSKNIIRTNWKGRVVAVKFLSEEAQDETFSERAQFWNGPTHQNVGQIYGISDFACSPSFIVLPYYSNGNVTQFLARHPDMDRKRLTFETAIGMQYLHSRDFIHGGLQPNNIMITDDLHACIVDYDMARIQSSRNNDSHRYFSPEAWTGIVSRPSDVYAFAMSAYEIFSSKLPWGSLSFKYIHQLVCYQDSRPDRPESAPGLTDQIWSIMEESWHREPRTRPTFDIIMRMWQDPNQAAYRPRGNQRRMTTRLTNTYGLGPTLPSRWSETTITSPPAYVESPNGPRMPRPRPLPIPVQSAPPTSSSAQFPPRNSTLSGRYTTAGSGTEPYSPPYSSASSVLSTPSPSVHDLFSPIPETPLTPVSAPAATIRPAGRGEPSHAHVHVPIIGNPPPGRSSGHGDQEDEYEEDSPILGRYDFLRQALPSPTPSSRSHTPSIISNSQNIRNWEARQRRPPSRRRTVLTMSTDRASARSAASSCNETVSIRSGSTGSSRSSGSSTGTESSVLTLVGGLQSEMSHGPGRLGKSDPLIDLYMAKIYHTAIEADQNAHKLITAGVVPLLITLLKRRAADKSHRGLEVVLLTLGVLSHDSISANLICRTQTATTLIGLCSLRNSDEVIILSLWCLNRICRNVDVATNLIKLDIVQVIKDLAVDGLLPAMAMYCLGTLIQSDAIADQMESLDIVPYLIRCLRSHTTQSQSVSDTAPIPPDEICSSLYAIARLSRSIRLARILATSGAIPLLSFILRYSRNPDILNWTTRSVGCMMRPACTDMAKRLLEAGVAHGLARLPTVLSQDCLYPLASLGFAIQRFSCAEWGNGTRVALLEAGVIDSLLAALRTAGANANENAPSGMDSHMSSHSRSSEYDEAQVELALALSLLGDVGGAVIRKEIISAGGIEILQSVGAKGSPDVAKACEMAVTSVSGNVLTRNAASARTAMLHHWIGGCPDYQPSCPLTLTIENRSET